MKLKKRRVILVFLLALTVLYFVGPKPSMPKYDITLPSVQATGYELEKYVSDLESKHKIREGNQAEIIWNNDSLKNKTEYVLLYLHGFSASKMEGESIHRDFAQRYGCNAYLARLSDHGVDTTDAMYFLTPDRLWESAKHAYSIAKQLGNKVIIMSTSTGGTLSLKIASEYPEITGLINMSPNIKINEPTAFLLNDPWGKWIAEKYLGSNSRTITGMDDFYSKYWYVTYRIESVVALEQLLETSMSKQTFRKTKTPTLNLYYFKDEEHQDEIVKVEAIINMHLQLGTNEELKRLIAIPNANTHIIGSSRYSNDFEKVKTEVFSFTDEVLKLSPIK